VKAYIVPDWLKIIAGLVIFQRQPELRVLLCLRSASEAAGQWFLLTGLGAIRRDITAAFAEALAGVKPNEASQILKNPWPVMQSMSERHRKAFSSSAGFALAEASWYLEISRFVQVQHLIQLKPICLPDSSNILLKLYYAVEWPHGPIKPAKTEWPFAEVRFFSREELKNISIAFGCDADLEDVFWPWLQPQS